MIKSLTSLVIITIILSSVIFPNAFGEEPILISISSSLDKIIFDGKWSSNTEWKESSYNNFRFDDETQIHLRTGHQGDFIYVQINVATDTTINKNSDSTIICFDTENNKTIIPQNDDYCFEVKLGSNTPITYQGNPDTINNNYFKKIPNHNDFIAIGTSSDKFDRYSKVPHVSYEFKIPLELLGRSDNYGFFFAVYEGQSQTRYFWPYGIDNNEILEIPAPDTWGQLISPDKSLPEFSFSQILFIIIPGLFLIYFASKTKFKIKYF